ncbi:MAG: hypothetical protein M1812_007502 [Candelaria pacifica]|nr:MAG: hypothetical protein M1812_007502 [Candelaria pacifica]
MWLLREDRKVSPKVQILARLDDISNTQQDIWKEIKALHDITLRQLPIETRHLNRELIPLSTSHCSQECLPGLARHDSIKVDDVKHEYESPPPELIVEAGELSIPIKHTTAAQKLLWWPSIQDLINGIKVDKNYVMDGEETRGILRLYGKGEGCDVKDEDQSRMSNSPSNPSESDDTPSCQASSLSESLWGTGFDMPNSASLKRPEHDNVGGLNPDGSLKLDPSTLQRLLTAYMNNIHILHPILDKQQITEIIERFAASYNRSNVTLSSFAEPAATSPNNPNMDPKRKRSTVPILNRNSHMIGLKLFPERSISSVLVLLVLALGKICEHRDPLPSLNETLRMGMSSQRTSVDECTLFNVSDSSLKNADVVPGLAYYAYATNILGNLHGGNDLSHVQAHLLAGLYAGQLARVLESWKWVNSACTACQVIIRSARFTHEKNLARQDLIILAFWTCLQLESDLLAELDLPHSGISRYEDSIPLPKGVTLRDHDSNHKKPAVMIYYSAQIYLRKILNRAHTALYRTKKTYPTNSGWSTINSADLEKSLEEWRKSLPAGFQWNDSDPPATDINDARMRAKYYGARYIIHRPSLHHAIHSMNPQDPFSLNSPTSNFNSSELLTQERCKGVIRPPKTATTSGRDTITEASQICVEAAMKSTVAFDGIEKLPVVTNIFGTAHAQFGNCLVLAATHRSTLHDLISCEELKSLLRRTIKFLRDLAPSSPTLMTDAEILEHLSTAVFNHAEQTPGLSSVSIGVDHGSSW